MNDLKPIEISLYGGVFVFGVDGENLTPKSAKGRALIALLATHDQKQRSRAWLQSKLWSDRAPEQASASLRREVANLRQILSDYQHVLKSSRYDISLHPELVNVRQYDGPSPEEAFLEGLDIKDDEFDIWLRDAKSDLCLDPTIKGSARDDIFGSRRHVAEFVASPSICFVPQSGDDTTTRIVEEMYVDIVNKSISELFDIHVVPPHRRQSLNQNSFEIQIRVSEFQNGSFTITNRILSQNGALLWSENCRIENVTGPIAYCAQAIAQSHQLFDKLTKLLSGQEPENIDTISAAEIATLAMNKTLSFGPGEMAKARSLWDIAIDRDPRGSYYAWRAQLSAIAHVERLEGDVTSNREISRIYCEKAMAMDPMNSYVLALNATSNLIFDNNIVGSLELAKLALKRNPANPVAWWAFCNAQLYNQQYEPAYRTAITAQSLAAGTRLQFWCDFQRSVTAAVTRRNDEAIKFGESSALLAPGYKPPLRYLIALYVERSDIANARRSANTLANFEGVLSPEQLIEDENYPVSLMRRTGLIKKEDKHILRDIFT